MSRNNEDLNGLKRVDSRVRDVRLDNTSSEEDNRERKACCGEDAKDSTHEGGSDEAAGSRKATDQSGFDFSKMMKMMERCCPDKMKDFASMMSDFEKRCRSSKGKGNSDEPA